VRLIALVETEKFNSSNSIQSSIEFMKKQFMKIIEVINMFYYVSVFWIERKKNFPMNVTWKRDFAKLSKNLSCRYRSENNFI